MNDLAISVETTEIRTMKTPYGACSRPPRLPFNVEGPPLQDIMVAVGPDRIWQGRAHRAGALSRRYRGFRILLAGVSRVPALLVAAPSRQVPAYSQNARF